jgi:hypothetical protein
MDEWLKQSGFYLGNAILCCMGLAFAIGAPAIAKFKPAKKWWIVLWASFLGFYLWSVLLFSVKLFGVAISMPLAIFNGISTAAAAMLYFHLRDKWRLNTKKATIICCVVFSLVALIGLFSLIVNSLILGVIGQIPSWIFFVLLAWIYRKQHMATTILLLAYANLQLPAGIIGKAGWGNDFVLLLAAKLSLIGAMYHTLGVRDAGK